MAQEFAKCALCKGSPKKECSFCGRLVCKGCARHKYYNRSLKKATAMCDLCYADSLRGNSHHSTPAKSPSANVYEPIGCEEPSVSLSEDGFALPVSKEFAKLQALNHKSTEELRGLQQLQRDGSVRKPSSRLVLGLRRRLNKAWALVEHLRQGTQTDEVREEIERFYSLQSIYTELCQEEPSPYGVRQCKLCSIQ